MEAGGQFQELKLTGSYRSDEYGVSSVVFDVQEELLWAATYGVRELAVLGASATLVASSPLDVQLLNLEDVVIGYTTSQSMQS